MTSNLQNAIDNQHFLCLSQRWITTRQAIGTPEIKETSSTTQKQTASGGLRERGFTKSNQPGKPLLSIITVVLNSRESLGQTINSVLRQDYDNVEYIIIDGGSSDGTVELLRQYEHTLDYWRSAPDQGIYDAMNQGIALAQGSLVGIINANDWYAPGVFAEIARRHAEEPNAILHGDMVLIKKAQPYCTIPAPADFKRLTKGMVFNHPTVFIPLSIYQKHGSFDLRFQIAADWDLMIRLWQNGEAFRKVPNVIANFRLGGTSFHFNRRHVQEKHAVRRKNRLCNRCDKYYILDLFKLLFPSRLIMALTLLKQKLFGG